MINSIVIVLRVTRCTITPPYHRLGEILISECVVHNINNKVGSTVAGGGPNFYFIIFVGTTFCGSILLCLYIEDELWFHVLTMFNKEIPMRKPLIEALKYGYFHKLDTQKYFCWVNFKTFLSCTASIALFLHGTS